MKNRIKIEARRFPVVIRNTATGEVTADHNRWVYVGELVYGNRLEYQWGEKTAC